MENECPQCGALLHTGETCRERFDSCLAFEYAHPEAYAQVHHLVVTCFMLQHNAYSQRGWLEAREMLRRAIQEGVTPEQSRKENRFRLDSRRRDWPITAGPRIPGVEAIAWRCTIASLSLESPEAYCATAKHWAICLLDDSEAIARRATTPES